MMTARCKNPCPTDWMGVECAWPPPANLGPTGHLPTARQRWRRRVIGLAASLLCLSAAWQLGQAGYIQAKAWLAGALIEDAWSRTLAGEEHARPWPWADTWPVARLSAPRLGVARTVLAGANGRTIAFGPGHVFGTPLPGEDGNSVIGAHRDTHFAFLQWLENGDEIEVETGQGSTLRYRVVEREVVDQRDLAVLASPPGVRRLTLVTCYPFDALRAGGPLRYVVVVEARTTSL
jgi:sortase A